MTNGENALAVLLEDHPEGLTVREAVEALEANGMNAAEASEELLHAIEDDLLSEDENYVLRRVESKEP